MSESQYDEDTEFSYTPSAIGKPHPQGVTSGGNFLNEIEFKPPRLRHSTDRNSNTGTESNYTTRDSYTSNISEYSDINDSIAQPVSVMVVNEPIVPTVNRSASQKQLKLQIGSKLNTQKGEATNIEPDVVYNTNAEGSIPRRSSKRPKSVNVQDDPINPLIEGAEIRHKKHVSLTISDDLDKLMQRANSIQLKSFTFTGLSSDSSLVELRLDTETLQMASGSPPQPLPKVKELPPRPSVDDLDRARQVSSKIEQKEVNANPNRISQSLPKPPIDIDSNSILMTDSDEKQEYRNSKASSGGYVPVPYTSSPENVVDFSSKVDNPQENVLSNLVYDDEESSNFNAPGYPNRYPEESVEVLPPITPHSPPKTIQKSLVNDINSEEEFYDIEEPEIINKPSRAKSVKDATKHPKRTKSKREKRISNKSQLKPFSYHTLINLLESINGTIIGEEFNQLNLPIKEKQLIEKIVDQLSRLTSDMVLDEQRYAIGIDRLERALRVLEGFL